MLLVTSGAGQISGLFVQTYLETFPEKNIAVIGDFSKESSDDNQRIKLFDGNIDNREFLDELFAKEEISGVVHLAGATESECADKNMFSCLESNVIHSITLFEAMETAGIKNIIFGSNQSLEDIEANTQVDITVFQESKRTIEQMLEFLHKTKNWSCLILRLKENNINSKQCSQIEAFLEHRTPTYKIATN